MSCPRIIYKVSIATFTTQRTTLLPYRTLQSVADVDTFINSMSYRNEEKSFYYTALSPSLSVVWVLPFCVPPIRTYCFAAVWYRLQMAISTFRCRGEVHSTR
jgi:hypothetical protein